LLKGETKIPPKSYCLFPLSPLSTRLKKTVNFLEYFSFRQFSVFNILLKIRNKLWSLPWDPDNCSLWTTQPKDLTI